MAPPDTLRRLNLDSLLQQQCGGYAQVRIAQILFVGNAVTKERVLRAELDIREGDTLAAADVARRLERNRRRLFNLQLFNQVNLQLACRNGELIVLYGVQERWYTFPVPIFSFADRNFRSWLDRPDRWRRLDYGVHVVRTNFRGRNEQLYGNLQLGFNRKYELFYVRPGLGRHRLGFSAGASLYQARAVDYTTRRDSLKAYRADNEFPIQRWYLTGGLRWRRTVQRLTTLELYYYQERITDSVRRLNPEYFLNATRRSYVDVVLSRTLNQRNTFAYPLTGSFLQASLTQRVFFSSPSPPITTALLTYARYFSLGHGFYYSAGAEGRLRLSRRLAYADSRALGYRQALVRGYDAYVVDGRHYGVLRQGLSLRVFDAGRLNLPVLNDPRLDRIPLVLYANVFTDAGFVAERSVPVPNRLPNELLASAGIGLHLVTYYDRVFTLEYTRTIHGFGGLFARTEFPF
ncbi:POTRA domain-containing protein [Hymenobacter sp. 15J16-1T3B]|uniref:POTRA domain-containing protein n=1 Tax=Hymenobacter sp. 15J16-1T3B TaxID=2886941 RepID=UPI001D0F8D1A|nr:POTRA domain-containing protein [Hymenobacter sp. 15J16-1T3B]